MLGGIARVVKAASVQRRVRDKCGALTTLRAVLSRRVHGILALIAALHAAITFFLALLRFHNVHQRTFDLALYARAAWGLAHGDSWLPVLDMHVLGAHMAPVLLVLGLLGRLFGTVPVVLLAQSLAVAACVWPLARIGARRMGTLGIWLAVSAWCLYPNLGHVTSYEFHPGTLAVLPLCWAYDALDRGKFVALAWSCVGVLACRDDFGLACVIFALLYALQYRDRRANWLALGSLAYTLLAVGITLAHAPQNASLSQHFGVWGGSPLGVLTTLFRDPGVVWAHFTARPRLLYLPRLLAPLSFFALRSPRLLLPALPYLALNLLSEFPTTLEQYSHYLTPAVPSLVVAGVVGVTVVKRRGLRVLWFVTLGLSQLALGGLPWSRDFDGPAFREDAQTRAARAVLARIPAAASVQAPDALLPHLVERHMVRRAPPPEAHTDFVVLDISHRTRFAGREDLLRTMEEPLVRSWLARADQALLVYEPPYALLQRGAPAREGEALKKYFLERGDWGPSPSGNGDSLLTACLGVERAQLEGDRLSLTLRAHGACPSDLALRIGAEARAARTDLLFAGALSPALLLPGDVVQSTHALEPALARRIRSQGVWLGLVRSSGARPEPGDPTFIHVPLSSP
jgi:uncharacterized membrane protein